MGIASDRCLHRGEWHYAAHALLCKSPGVGILHWLHDVPSQFRHTRLPTDRHVGSPSDQYWVKGHRQGEVLKKDIIIIIPITFIQYMKFTLVVLNLFQEQWKFHMHFVKFLNNGHGAGIWNPALYTSTTRLSSISKTMVADNIVMQGFKVLATIILNHFPRIMPVSTHWSLNMHN